MNSVRASVVGAFLIRRMAYDQKIFSGIRYLYTQQFLHMDKYVTGRELTRKQYGNMKDNFMKRMRQQVDSSMTSMIFTEDLKSVVHLCEGSPEDLDLCKNMIKKFHHQNKELRFGTFVFGPVVMRMLYHLQQADLALELIKDPEVDGFFDQLKSFFLLMDLLFEEGRYQDVLDLNDMLIKKQLHDTKFPRDCFVLTCAACYKMNTPESYQYAINLVSEARASGAEIIQRALHFVIMLALNQNQPEVAMELLSSLQMKNNIIANNLKLQTLVRLNRVHEAFNLLRRKVEEDFPSPNAIRGDICTSSLDLLEEAVKKMNETEISHTFEQLSRSLKEAGYITTETVEQLVLTPVSPRPMIGNMPPGMRSGFSQGPPRMQQRFGNRREPFFNRERREPMQRQALGSISSD